MGAGPVSRRLASILALLALVPACELKTPDEPKYATRSGERPGGGDSPIGFEPVEPCPLCDLFDRVAPTVVAVFGRGLHPPDTADAFEDFVRRFFGDSLPVGLGSGVVVDKLGLVLTNYHVVEGTSRLVVRTHDGQVLDATMVGADPDSDLALIQLEGGGIFPAAELGDSARLRVGQTVAAVGNPAGLSHTFTVGVLSAVNRTADAIADPGLKPGLDYLQTDAALSRGSSGGPLFDTSGRVIGINTMVHAVAAGLGFAVPVNRIKELLPRLKAGWRGPPWLGLKVAQRRPVGEGDPAAASAIGLQISEVVLGSPAEEAGLRVGDVLLEFAGYALADRDRLRQVLEVAVAGKPVDLLLLRGAEKLTVEVVPRLRQERGETAPASAPAP